MKFSKDEIYCFDVKSIEEIESIIDILNFQGINTAWNIFAKEYCIEMSKTLILKERVLMRAGREVSKKLAIWVDVKKLIEYHGTKRETISIGGCTFDKEEFEKAVAHLKEV